MRAILRVTDGPFDSPPIVIESGEVKSIGRERGDIVVNNDSQMSSAHAALKWVGDQFIVEDQNSTNGTWVNESRVSGQTTLCTNDELRCGTTKFSVAIDQQPASQPAETSPVQRDTAIDAPGAAAAASAPAANAARPTPAPGSAPAPHDHDHDDGRAAAAQEGPVIEGAADESNLQLVRGFCEDSAMAVCARFGLEDLVLQPEDGETPEAFAMRLRKHGETQLVDEDGNPEPHLNDALTFLAYAMPKRCAIWWLTRCIRSVKPELPPDDEAVVRATEEWIAEPLDKKRRHAMDLAQNNEFGTPASWTGVAAFWSSGSMTPPNVPPVPPKDEFTGKAVSGAIIGAALMDQPEKALEKQQSFFDMALAVAAGDNSWA